MSKVKSALELGKFKTGQTVYWVVFRPIAPRGRSLTDSDRWMRQEHPKVYFERKILSPLWNSKRMLPRLHAADFHIVTQLVTQRVVIEPYNVHGIRRSDHTGEYYYINHRKEEMPEKCLFLQRSEAVKEQKRIRKILREWLDHWE